MPRGCSAAARFAHIRPPPDAAVSMTPISRRKFVTTAATAAGAVTLGCSDRSIIAPRLPRLTADPLPDPAASGIEHAIVFMMENRSFDPFLGWPPGPDVTQAGPSHCDSHRPEHGTVPIEP